MKYSNQAVNNTEFKEVFTIFQTTLLNLTMFTFKSLIFRNMRQGNIMSIPQYLPISILIQIKATKRSSVFAARTRRPHTGLSHARLRADCPHHV